MNNNDQCEDIDECELYGSNEKCPRRNNICHNTDGSFECKCKDSKMVQFISENCYSEEVIT